MSVISVDAQSKNEEIIEDALNIGESKTEENNNYLFIKRFSDILISIMAGIICFVPMILVSLLIYIESPGPVIYSQERLGKNGKPFTMYKFRSMYLDAEKNGPQWAKVNDNRCTKIGKIIRMCHIDELPQLWNILIGDMSIVGPRPERRYFYDEFEKTIPDFKRRLTC